MLSATIVKGQSNNDSDEEKLNRSHPENFIAYRRYKNDKKEMEYIFTNLIALCNDYGNRIDKLKNAQKAWEKYREMDMKTALTYFSGGWPESTEYYWRYAELIEQRVSRLKILLKMEYIGNSSSDKKKNIAEKIKEVYKKAEKMEADNKKEIEALEKDLQIKAESFIEPDIQW